jgi:hypothetical protein
MHGKTRVLVDARSLSLNLSTRALVAPNTDGGGKRSAKGEHCVKYQTEATASDHSAVSDHALLEELEAVDRDEVHNEAKPHEQSTIRRNRARIQQFSKS